MNTHITEQQLCAYLDDELDTSARAEVEHALAQDARLKAKLADWTAQTISLRDALDAELDESLPEAWLQLARTPALTMQEARSVRPRASVRAWAQRLTRWIPAPRFATGLALAVMLGIFVGRDLIPRLDMDGQLVRLASVAHYVYSPDKRQPVEVKAEDPTLTDWISERLGAKVLAPNLTGYRLMGGRLLAGAEEPAGQFMYEEAAGKRLTVFVRTEGAAGRATEPKCSAYRGVNVCFWYAGGVAYALAGEVPETNLSALAGSATASTRLVMP